MAEIVIASAARTPIGTFNGALGALPAHKLGQKLSHLRLGLGREAPPRSRREDPGAVLVQRCRRSRLPARQDAFGHGRFPSVRTR